MGVLTSCTPRAEVLKGDLEDAIFAADFGNVISDQAPAVYNNPVVFFNNTHPAAQLKKVVQVVFGRLADVNEGGAVLRLSTGYGGGKTHTLIALYHLARHISDLSIGTELLPAAGRPRKVTCVAIDASKAGVHEFASHGATQSHSLWGEVFWALGGEQALQTLGQTDDPETSPSEAQIKAVFPAGPMLLLLDELVIYMAKLSERGQGNLLGFLNNLAAIAASRPQTVLVVTDPGTQAVYATEAARIGDVARAADRLDQVIGRTTSDFDPIGGEAARVIVRRLFDRVDGTARQAASAVYHDLYQRIEAESPGTIPAVAARPDYASRIVECYPFHPRFLDTAQDRLGALQVFQKSRGVLRLFARILRDIWEAGIDCDLISAGEINWSSPRIQGDLLQRLNREDFRPAITADIEKHAAELDGGVSRGIHCRVASALLLESLPLQSNSGLDQSELALAVLRPDEAGHEPAEALDRLLGTCWHTYPMAGGRGYQFRYEPNIIKQIEERKDGIPLEDARSRVLSEVQECFRGPGFELRAWPDYARQVPELARLQLALCRDEAKARLVCSCSDDRDPAAPIPRGFRNAIVAVAPTGSAFNQALDRAQRLLAVEDIERGLQKEGDSARLARPQLERLRPRYERDFRLQTRRAFDRVVVATDGREGLSAASYPMEEQFQVSDDDILRQNSGQKRLKDFLEAKGFIYRQGDTLDVNRFLQSVLPGATPLPDMQGVYTARSVHERFLSAPKLRLIPDGGIVRQTILKAVAEGKLVVRLADGRTYDAGGYVGGMAGARRRETGSLTTLALDDTVLITLHGTEVANTWLKEDEPTEDGGGRIPPPQPPPSGRIVARSWTEVLDYAGKWPLLELRLTAKSPLAAGNLAGLAQPLGAESLTLSVAAYGPMKDGGSMNFAANNVRVNNPTRPLDIARTLFNALAAGATYEAELALSFGAAGRTGLGSQLQTMAESAADGISPTATFDRPAASP